MPNCIVPFCGNRGTISGVQYFRVTESRREQWLRAIGRGLNDKLTVYSRICSVHFRPDDFQIVEDRKILKSSAVPALKLRPVDIRKQLFTKRSSKPRSEACEDDRKADESILDDSSISTFQHPSTSSQNFSPLEQPSTRMEVDTSGTPEASTTSWLLVDIKEEPLYADYVDKTNITIENGQLQLKDLKLERLIKEEVNTSNIKFEPLITEEYEVKTAADDQDTAVSTEEGDSHKTSLRHRLSAGKQPFECAFCGNQFVYNYQLQNHLTTHNGKKPLKCNLCGFKTSLKKYLQRHLKGHTGEKPYKCDLCNYSSVDSSALHRHSVLHTGRKDFQCDECNLKFALKNNLNKHLKIHARQKNFKCDLCSRRFAVESALQFHLKSHVA